MSILAMRGIGDGLGRAEVLGVGAGQFDFRLLGDMSEGRRRIGAHASVLSNLSQSWKLYSSARIGMVSESGDSELDAAIEAGIRARW